MAFAGPGAMEAMKAAGRWFSVPGGWPVLEQGAKADALYVVLAGKLVVVRRDAGGAEEVVGYVRPGEPVGEIAWITDQPYGASAYALRDTELLRIEFDDLSRLTGEHSDLVRGLARFGMLRIRRNRATLHKAAPRVFAIVGCSSSIDPAALAHELAGELAAIGVRAVILGEEALDLTTADYAELERTSPLILLPSRLEDSAWYRFVVRHADRLWAVTRRDARPSTPLPLAPDERSPARRFRLVDVIVMDEYGAAREPIINWIDAVGARRVFIWRDGRDAQRLARVMARRTVGVVFSGGGARAYAHIGAARAFMEMGVPFDFLGGASMGAIVAAGLALGWSLEELTDRVRRAFVASNPLGDHRLPVVALTRGGRVEERLREHFGEVRIEEMRTPFFCVSTDLVSGRVKVHKRGLLREALRASIALPGILPPVVSGEELLVDGAVLNNCPADIMRDTHRGRTIAVDVARESGLDLDDFRRVPNFFEWVWRHGLTSPPPIVSLLMRSATVMRPGALASDDADLTIAPELPGVEIRDWKSYDDTIEAGYVEAKAAMATAPQKIKRLCVNG